MERVSIFLETYLQKVILLVFIRTREKTSYCWAFYSILGFYLQEIEFCRIHLVAVLLLFAYYSRIFRCMDTWIFNGYPHWLFGRYKYFMYLL